MRRAVLLVICSLALAAPATAQAQAGLSLLFLGVTPGKEISDIQFPASVAGEVSVSYHADPASGCAALGDCAYSGVVAWTPGGGSLDVTRTKWGHRVHIDGQLSLGETGNGSGSLIAATVHRSIGARPEATCDDAQSGLATISATVRRGELSFALSQVLAPTRCAGPLPSDLANAAPAATVPMSRLTAGNLRLDFRTQRSFTAHGLAGTLTSTVVVTLGRPRSQPVSPSFPPGIKTQRLRFVSEPLRLTAASGTLTASVTGTRNAELCVLLDTCGLAGTLSFSPKVVDSIGELVATGPAKRPYRDFLTALGLSSTGHSAGIEVNGILTWDDSGTVAESLRQSTSCTDRDSLGSGAASLQMIGRRLRVRYLGGGALLLGGQTGLRTRCPGPLVAPGTELAAGSVPRLRFRHRSLTVRLRATRAPSDQGYDMSLAGALTLRMRLGPLRQQIATFPAP
jgi:hypothetical protein